MDFLVVERVAQKQYIRRTQSNLQVKQMACSFHINIPQWIYAKIIYLQRQSQHISMNKGFMATQTVEASYRSSSSRDGKH